MSAAVQGLQTAKKAGCDAFVVPYWSSPMRMRARRHVEGPSTEFDRDAVRQEWLGYLKNGCAGLDLLFGIAVALPEDVEAVSRLADLFVVTSYEARDRELTRAIAAARGERPVFVATAMQDGRDELDLPKDAIRLHSVAAAPCPLEQANLGAIEPHEGYWDHTRAVFTGSWAVMAGADYLAVPFRLGHTSPAWSGYSVALSPDLLASYIYLARTAAEARGGGEKVIQDAERAQLPYRVVR